MAALSEGKLREVVNMAARYGNNEAAKRLGIPRTTLISRIRVAERRGVKPDNAADVPVLSAAQIPTGRMSDDELWARVEGDYRRRAHAHDARRWFPVMVGSDDPMGICWFGDPHLDDNGCNVPLLRAHMKTVAETPGMVGANIGDTTNNWVGRLVRLYEEQAVTRSSALQLIESFLLRSGIEWLLVLLGNHDAWGHNSELLEQMTRNIVPLFDWQAQIELRFPGGLVVPVWAAHDFSGHSQWNPLHAPMKAAQMTGQAALYVCGHKHNWAIYQTEDAHRGTVYWTARARGYKQIDDHAERLGHGSQQYGQSIVSVIDPRASSGDGGLRCFANVDEGADYLTWLRQKRGV